MNKQEKVTTLSNACLLLEFTKKHLTTEQAAEIEKSILIIENVMDNIYKTK